MDLQELIELFGSERIEEYLKLYVTFGNTRASLVDILLDIINAYLVSFDATRCEPVIDISQVKDFLVCVVFFRSCFRI
ncbi:ORF4 [Jasmine virus A-1]|nr:ORF4 [Jasmine virus A-1]WMX21266.1 9 kDa protein [Jasmine virus A-1]